MLTFSGRCRTRLRRARPFGMISVGSESALHSISGPRFDMRHWHGEQIDGGPFDDDKTVTSVAVVVGLGKVVSTPPISTLSAAAAAAATTTTPHSADTKRTQLKIAEIEVTLIRNRATTPRTCIQYGQESIGIAEPTARMSATGSAFSLQLSSITTFR